MDVKINLYRTVPPQMGLSVRDDSVSDGVLYALWHNMKLDTYDIARRVGLPESTVANRLPKIRAAIRPPI
jgi:hypothetical protein